MPKTEGGLTDKQQRFVEEYLIDGNATRAATAAGYSAATAESQGSRLLKNVKVAAELDKGRQIISENVEITREWLMEQAKGILIDARRDRQHNAATSALKELGVLSGHRVEKQENTIITHEDRLAAVRERVSASGQRPTTH